MITWIQTTFQKHYKFLAAGLLVVVTVAFVLTIGNQSFFGSGGQHEFRKKNFFGVNLASDRERSWVEQRAMLSAQLSPELQVTRQTLEQYGQARVAGLAIADRLGIPEPSEAQMRDYVRSRPIFQNEQGEFDPTLYERIVTNLGADSGQGSAGRFLALVLEEDWRINQIQQAAAGAGFIHPYVADVRERLMNTVWTVNVATLSEESVTADIDPSTEQLQQFFQESGARFEVPEQIQLKAVRFPASAFASQVQAPTDAELRAYFERNKNRYRQPAPQPAEGEEPQQAPEPVFEDVRAQVATDIVNDRARRLAAEAADAYTVALWREEVAKGSPRVEALARNAGATIEMIEPFSRRNPPRDTGLPMQGLASGWNLQTSERYFSDVIPTQDGAAVLLYQGAIPARMPAFEEVVEDVEQAYTEEQTHRYFVERGEDIRKELQQAVESGRDFTETAKELGLTVNSYSEFKEADAPMELRFGPMEVARRMRAGQVSPMQASEDQGTFVYVAKRDTPATAEGDQTENLASIRESIRNLDSLAFLDDIAQRRLDEIEAEEAAERGE